MKPEALGAADALFLDFDGTLVEIAEHPERVALPRNLPSLLASVRDRLNGALAIVSGRRLEDIDRWLAPARFAGAGVHGAQLRLGGELPTLEKRADFTQPIGIARASVAGFHGTWVENKGSSLALHYRADPAAAEACLALAESLARQFQLVLVRGKMVVELKLPGIDKGVALRRLMQVLPFCGRRPVFLGDDVTDEDGFAAAAELGGFGVHVGEGPSLAPFRLDNVDAAIAWLGQGTASVRP